MKENKDFISGMAVDDSQRTLLATSGDGRLSVVDLRKRKLEEQSDCNESELLSVAILKVCLQKMFQSLQSNNYRVIPLISR